MIKRLLLGIALIAGALVSWPRHAAAMGETDTVILDANAGTVLSVVMDSSGTFAYFGTFDSPGHIIKVRLADFVVVSSLTLPTTSQWGEVGIIDPQNNYAYFASGSSPTVISKVNLSTFTFISSVTLPTPFGPATSAVMDPSGNFGYFGTDTAPGHIAKIQLSDLSLAAGISLGAGEDSLISAVVDSVTNFAYFGTATVPGKVIKINLGGFTHEGTRTLNSGEGPLNTVVLSTHTDTAYFGTGGGEIVRVRLSDFTRRPSLTLSDTTPLLSSVIDSNGSFAYFGSNASPGKIFRIRLSDFSEDTSTTITDNVVCCGVIHSAADFAYFGTGVAPPSATKIDLDDTRAGPPVFITNPTSQTGNIGGAVTFTVVPGGSAPFTYQWLKNGVAIGGATSASYTTPALTFDDDGASYQCAVTNAFGTATSAPASVTVMPVINVFPQPWRSDRHPGIPLTFEGVAPNSTLKIYTLSMHWVKSVEGNDPITWDLTNDAGQRVASGYYFYIITTQNERQNVRGKFAIIK